MNHQSPQSLQSNSEIDHIQDYLSTATLIPFEDIVAMAGDDRKIERTVLCLPSFGIRNKEKTYGSMLSRDGYSIETNDLEEDSFAEFAITENNLIVLPVESFRVTALIAYNVKVLGRAPSGYYQTLKNYAEFRKAFHRANRIKKTKSKKYADRLTYFYFDLWLDDDIRNEVLPLSKAELFEYLENL